MLCLEGAVGVGIFVFCAGFKLNPIHPLSAKDCIAWLCKLYVLVYACKTCGLLDL